MTEIKSGIITFAEFGTVKDYPFLIGLQLGFSMGIGEVMDGGRYTVSFSKDCKWGSQEGRTSAITEKVEFVYDILKEAKVNYVSELVGKPVVITLENNMFKSFRILTEVL